MTTSSSPRCPAGLTVLFLLPALLGAAPPTAPAEPSGASLLPRGLEHVSSEAEEPPCLALVEVEAGELLWPVCFDDPSKAKAVRKRLRREGIPASVEQVGRWERVVRYSPLSSDEAEDRGRIALQRRPEAEHGMLEVVVDWEPDLRSFVWELEATCPAGWRDLGVFKLTAYVLAQEKHFSEEPLIDEPCGLEGVYRESFLFGEGVKLQGSGLTLDGRIVHWREGDCFELTRCAKTASTKCAKTGRTVAVDPKVIPMGGELLIEGVGLRVAEDVGGRIRGQHIDVYYGTDLSVTGANSRTRVEQLVCLKEVASSSTN